MGKKEDLTGKVFERLTVIKDSGERKHGSVMWLCQCQCGNYILARADGLKNGDIKSCGCLHKEVASILGKARAKDLTGQIFGKLTVIEPTEKRANGFILWKCLCDCGNYTFVRCSDLTRGLTKSCGCTIESHGELKIKEILKNNNISFEQQKKFENCKDIRALPFDFYVDNKYIIEYDGIQHFKSIDHFDGEEGLKVTQEHDRIKNEYCKNNNIPIIRIPYTHLNELCLEDLLLETSKFIVI